MAWGAKDAVSSFSIVLLSLNEFCLLTVTSVNPQPDLAYLSGP